MAASHGNCCAVSRFGPWALALTAILGLAGVLYWGNRVSTNPVFGQPRRETVKAPELEGGKGWLNAVKPVKLADLKGKIVLLDFWTYCCINCIHTLPDLAKLEKKYEKQLVVIGVHSAKFDTEKDSEAIRKAVNRYDIRHPVVNDGDQTIWKNYGVNSWPTLVLIDPEGNIARVGSGEGLLEEFDRAIASLIESSRSKKTLNEEPVRFDTAKFRDADTPLFFPGKIHADLASKRLFIADSSHNRIVITDLDGKKLDICGNGEPGRADGSFEKAQFEDPQGLALVGDKLFVADRRNHSIRMVDLKTRIVNTVAGTGEQDRTGRFSDGGPGLKTGLNSPWDLLVIDGGKTLLVAMAGHHQLWKLDLSNGNIAPFAGDGRENIKDGPLYDARFAQPSGLSYDGKKYVYVADSETSSIRQVPLDPEGRVETLVGTGLFDFGDEDGIGREAKLQHPLAVQYYQNKVYVADTYNSKLKVIDLKDRSVKTIMGGIPKQGEPRTLNEPAGLSLAGDKLYIADTNAHRILVLDLATNRASVLGLAGLEPLHKK